MATRWKQHQCRAAVLPVSDGQLDDLNDTFGHAERKCRGFANHQTFTFNTERLELGLFTRDEMTWAFESAGMAVRYDSKGLMARGLYLATQRV